MERRKPVRLARELETWGDVAVNSLLPTWHPRGCADTSEPPAQNCQWAQTKSLQGKPGPLSQRAAEGWPALENVTPAKPGKTTQAPSCLRLRTFYTPLTPITHSHEAGCMVVSVRLSTLLTFNCQPVGVGCVPVALLGSCQRDSGGSRDSTLLSSVNAFRSPPGVTSGQHGPGLQPPLERSNTVGVSSLLLWGWCWRGPGEKHTHTATWPLHYISTCDCLL